MRKSNHSIQFMYNLRLIKQAIFLIFSVDFPFFIQIKPIFIFLQFSFSHPKKLFALIEISIEKQLIYLTKQNYVDVDFIRCNV